MTDLPFPDNSFDLVLSNIAIHNVKGKVVRNKVIEEAVRVLKPGGRLLIADMRGTSQYRDRLVQLGMTGVTRKNLGWRLWWSGPWRHPIHVKLPFPFAGGWLAGVLAAVPTRRKPLERARLWVA